MGDWSSKVRHNACSQYSGYTHSGEKNQWVNAPDYQRHGRRGGLLQGMAMDLESQRLGADTSRQSYSSDPSFFMGRYHTERTQSGVRTRTPRREQARGATVLGWSCRGPGRRGPSPNSIPPEEGSSMRICAFDIETTDLKALMGGVLVVSFQPIAISLEFTKTIAPYTFRIDDPRFKPKGGDWEDDSKLVDAVLRELEQYDLIVSWNGKLFDRKFLYAKALEHRLAPARLRWHLDAMWIVRNGMKIGSSKLDNVSKFLDLEDRKTEIAWKEWRKAARGVKSALDEVQTHCEQDVKVLAEAYWILLPYVRQLRMDG